MIDHDNLEEFADAERYDIEDGNDTGVAFYAALAQESGGPVLELACGTGRVGIPLAQLGFALTGLDIVPGMLALARRKSAGLPARWLEGDARAFDLGKRFRLIFITGNAFQGFLTRADQEALLGCVRAHLHNEGLFAFETRNPRPDAIATHLEEQESARYTEQHRRSGRDVRVSKSQVYDPASQILQWTTYRRWHEDGKEQTTVTRIALRFTGPQELAGLLHNAGFAILRQYGDWDGSPLSATSPSIIVVCRKIPARLE
jgi:SAM-dependent methyltransferase